MTDFILVRELQEACEEQLKTLDAAWIAEIEKPYAARTGGYQQFLERERATYSFGLSLMRELQVPTGLWRTLFP